MSLSPGLPPPLCPQALDSPVCPREAKDSSDVTSFLFLARRLNFRLCLFLFHKRVNAAFGFCLPRPTARTLVISGLSRLCARPATDAQIPFVKQRMVRKIVLFQIPPNITRSR